MFGRYIRYAIRHLLKNRLFSLINITGLTIGITSAMFILIWVVDELSMDRYHNNLENIFRVMENQFYSEDQVFTFAATPGVMAPKMKDDFPEIVHATRMTWEYPQLLNHNNKSLYFSTRSVDQDFLDMFTFEVIEGDLNNALKDHSSMVITKEVAEAFFRNESALGRSFKVDNDHDFIVTAVIENIPATSSYPFDVLLPVELYVIDNPWANQWYNNNLRTFIELTPGTDWKIFNEKVKNYIKENREETTNIELFIQPYSRIHLYSNFKQGKSEGGRILYVRIFSIVGIFILVIAGINFMNLSTAISTKRAKEVGIRKIAGSGKAGLIGQFLIETMVVSIVVLILALILLYLLLPVFNQVTEKKVFIEGWMLMFSFLIALVTGLLAGMYPAFYIARYQPSQVLKGELESGSPASLFRRLLVIFQFSLSIFLITGTLVVFQQMKFIYNRNIGINKENLIFMPMRQEMLNHSEAIRNTLLRNKGIINMTVTSQHPVGVGNSTSSVEWPGKEPDEKILFSNFSADFDFVETFQIEMIAGRDFDSQYPSDSSNFIMNETAARAMGYTADSIINEEITFWGDRKGRVIGVMKDYNFQSIHVPIEPLVVLSGISDYGLMHIRVDMDYFDEVIGDLEKLQKTYAPEYPLEFEFLEDRYASMYQSEQRMSYLMDFFAIVGIIISCLGLYGLAAFATERRTKELGIRKVMGASVGEIIGLVSREYVIIVFIAFIISFPVAWFSMSRWLNSFAYHINQSILTFLFSAGISLVLAILTVSYFALKAAHTNPVNALRYE